MYISLNWLKDYVKIPSKYSPEELGDLLTLKTAEIEEVINKEKELNKCVIGKVLTVEKHPNADKLKLCDVDLGKEKKRVVCGGNNLKVGMLIPYAYIGAYVRWHGEGDLLKLEKAKIRGEESDGMICAGEEIGIEKAPEGGISDLSYTNAKPGTPLAEALNMDDTVLEVDNKSLTHRPDLWGHYGFAREVAAVTNSKLEELNPQVEIPKSGDMVDIKVEDSKLCPRYCGLIIKDVKIEESPDWLKTRITSAGYRPISNIVDITNFVMAEFGQPMHAFDKKYIEKGIIVRRAKNGEKITTLDKEERKLSDSMLLICDHKKPVAIAGVMGGENSEIKDSTTDIILESANFNPSNVRKTSVKLGLRTEAVQRFEKSLDPQLCEKAIKRAAELILKLCPSAKIAGPITDINNAKQETKTTVLNIDRAKSIIGADISEKEIVKILENLDFKLKEKSPGVYDVEIPSYRATKDVEIEEDIIEEIARMYGYDNIKPTLPELPIKVPTPNHERSLKHTTRKILSYGLGLFEVFNYSFYGKDELNKCLMSEEDHLYLDNYLSEDQTHLRTTLVPNFLKTIQRNLRFQKSFNLYEVGRTYVEEEKEFPYETKNIILGSVSPQKSKKPPFYNVKSTLEKYFQTFKAPDFKIVKSKKVPPYAHPGECADILMRGKLLGQIFTVNPQVLKNFDIKAQVALAEFNFTLLAQYDQQTEKYQPISKFPALDFDISVVIDKKKEYSDIQHAIKKAEKDLITDIELFDHYEGPNISEDKKALAFKVILQSFDRTLTDDHMAEIQQKIFSNLKTLGGEIRGA